MKFVSNAGTDRVLDLVRPWLKPGHQLDAVSPSFSLFAFAEVLADAAKLSQARLVLPAIDTANASDLRLLGNAADRPARNQLQAPWLARKFAAWVEGKAHVRQASGAIPQGTLVMRDAAGQAQQAVLGSFAFSTEGLGLTPGNPLSLVQASENSAEAAMLSRWFDAQRASLKDQPETKTALIDAIKELSAHRDPSSIYTLMLHHLFSGTGEGMDEDRIVKSATGIRNTVVWKKLYKFQRDGVVGALDKLERFGGCIIADSVGLGKTFEALAIIKYHELRNDRVLVLCPERLRDNWTLYKANDRRNVLSPDRLNYDVLTLTDFRIDLAQHLEAYPGKLESMPLGASAVTTSIDADIPPGVVFCLRAEGPAAEKTIDPSYPLAPHYLVHAGDDGTVLLPYTQAIRTPYSGERRNTRCRS